MVRLDWRRKMAWTPSQTPGILEATGLSRSEVEEAAWAIAPDGRRLRGAGAIAAAADQTLPMGLPLFSAAYALPGLRQAGDLAYAWVARNRHRFPGTAACAVGRPPAGISDSLRWEIERRARKAEMGWAWL